jgi:hypothetical protein
VLFYLAAWFLAFGILYYQQLLYRIARYRMAETYDPQSFLVSSLLINLIPILAGLALVAPLLWARRREGFYFNHGLFWSYSIPLLFLLAFSVMYFSNWLSWLLPLISQSGLLHFLHDITTGPLVGTLIGVALGLSMLYGKIQKPETEGRKAFPSGVSSSVLIGLLAVGTLFAFYQATLQYIESWTPPSHESVELETVATLFRVPEGDDRLEIEVRNTGKVWVTPGEVKVRFPVIVREGDLVREEDSSLVLVADRAPGDTLHQLQQGQQARFVCDLPKDHSPVGVMDDVPEQVSVCLENWLYQEGRHNTGSFGSCRSGPLSVVTVPETDLGVLKSLDHVDWVVVDRSPYQDNLIVADGLDEAQEFIGLVAGLPAQGGSFPDVGFDTQLISLYSGSEWVDYLKYVNDGYDGYLIYNDREADRQLRARISPQLQILIDYVLEKS